MDNREWVKTTIILYRETYKAARFMAVERETTVSAMVRAGLALYMADPERAEKVLAQAQSRRIDKVIAKHRSEKITP